MKFVQLEEKRTFNKKKTNNSYERFSLVEEKQFNVRLKNLKLKKKKQK